MRAPNRRELLLALAHRRGEVGLVPQFVARLADTMDEHDLEAALQRTPARPAAPAPRHPTAAIQDRFATFAAQQELFRTGKQRAAPKEQGEPCRPSRLPPSRKPS